MNLSFWLIIFVLGTCLGSFLNCIIYRLKTKKSFLKGRSFCPNCRHRLTFFDLMPILSFVILKGKCRYCGRKISIQYPLVELATGFLFLSIFWIATLRGVPFGSRDFGFDLTFDIWILDFSYLAIISSLLIIIFVYDLKHFIIPNKIIYSAILVFCIWYFVSGIFFEFYTKYEILNTIYAAFGASGFFFLLWLVSRGKWMGLGDVKLAFFMGLFLGFPNVLAAMFLAFFIGAIIGIGLIIGGKKTLKSQVPFGPFLIAGTFLALFWGREIINWYINLLI